MEKLGSHWTDFHDSYHTIIFSKSVEKIQISIKCDNTSNNGYLTLRPIHIFDHISLSVLLRMRNVSNKFVVKRVKYTFYVQ